MENKSLPREDLDYELGVEEEELTVLHRQLEAARKEEELLKKRGEADNLRHRIAEQHRSNAKLRGMPNDANNKKNVKTESKQSKISYDVLDVSDIDVHKLRKKEVT